MKILQIAALGALLLAASGDAQGATIVSWDGLQPTLDPSATFVNASFGTVGDPLGRGPGIQQIGTSGAFNSNGWTTSNASFADAIAEGDFLTFGFTTTTAVNLSTMDIAYSTTNSGPQNLQIQLSVNGAAFSPVFTDANISVIGTGVPDVNLGIDLSAYTNVTDADFRIALYGATLSGSRFGTALIDQINGNTTTIEIRGAAVPEPATAGLALCGLVFVCLRRRVRSAR